MRRILVASFAVAALTVSAPASVAAQGCTTGAPEANEACATGRDLLLYMAPQLGTSLVGGSHTLGIGTNLGGLFHFAIALRANAVMGSLPDIDNVGANSTPVSQNYAVKDQYLGLPTVDFALGLTKGFNLGVTRIGGIDLIGGATYVPEITEDDFSVTAPDGSLSIGYGARVGLLQQSALIPGVAFSWMKRDMPTLNMMTTTDGGDEFSISNLAIKSTSWRLSAQKNFFLFQFGAGFGKDNYDFNADVAASVDGGTHTGSFNASQEMSRTTMYGSLGINLFLVKIVGEVGQVSGGSAPTFHTYDTAADAKRMYGTVGVRISF
ncbi:MAG TPA: hypothetical protein PK788_10575 [Gemmatimonadaceae bacterium]|nr:hypothetical protein [Gemmatimonadaceae bacterium]HRQ78045.1 hypothetical protein [Gemmatimonadaceae bacterium]